MGESNKERSKERERERDSVCYDGPVVCIS